MNVRPPVVFDASAEAIASYRDLGPDQVLDAVESSGLTPDGRLLALNSYENRVYQVGIEGAEPVIAKFYRPGRWSDDAILEEHAYTLELAAAEIGVVAPLADATGVSLHHHGSFRYALYPRRGGRAPELDDPEHLERLGRLIARLHNVGAVRPFVHRPSLSIAHHGIASRDFLLASGMLPPAIEPSYRQAADALIAVVEECFTGTGPIERLRLHGDCHPGNILAGPKEFALVDFDDAMQGPAVQDLWMFLSGDRAYQRARREDLLAGYEEFRDFDYREIRLIEALRALRIMHYAAWLARRWDDPAFPKAFPWFNTERYWDEHVMTLREQVESVRESLEADTP